MTSVAKRYAQALFELTLEENQLDQILQEMTKIQHVLESCPELKDFVNRSLLKPEQVQDFFQELSSCLALSKTLSHFLQVLTEQKRHSLLLEIIHLFLQEVQKYQKTSKAFVSSARPLTEEQRLILIQTLEKHFDQKIMLEEKVDSQLIAGIVLDYEGFRIDTSLKTQLAQWQHEIRM